MWDCIVCGDVVCRICAVLIHNGAVAITSHVLSAARRVSLSIGTTGIPTAAWPGLYSLLLMLTTQCVAVTARKIFKGQVIVDVTR